MLMERIFTQLKRDTMQEVDRKRYFVTYDMFLQEEDCFLISGDFEDSLISRNGILQMRVWKNYIFLKQISNRGFLGYMDHDNVIKICSGEDFVMGTTLYPKDDPIFFLHGSNTYFTLDVEQKQLIPHQTKEQYTFLQLMTIPGGIVFVSDHQNNKRQQIYVNKEQLRDF